jgi:signal transduction histidine kinase
VVTSLRPAALDAGLLPALEWLTQDFNQRTGIPCHLKGPEPDPDVREALSAVIFRIAQESLTNVARHAGATKVLITLRQSKHSLTLTIEDNGCGFDANARRPQAGFGLLSMTERALSLGGCAHIDSSPGKGTSITVEVPW